MALMAYLAFWTDGSELLKPHRQCLVYCIQVVNSSVSKLLFFIPTEFVLDQATGKNGLLSGASCKRPTWARKTDKWSWSESGEYMQAVYKMNRLVQVRYDSFHVLRLFLKHLCLA